MARERKDGKVVDSGSLPSNVCLDVLSCGQNI